MRPPNRRPLQAAVPAEGAAPATNLVDFKYEPDRQAVLDRLVPQALAIKMYRALLESVAGNPERAFEDLRALLFDVATALVRCDRLSRAAEILAGFDAHRFAPLLHHYELSNWILSTRASGSAPAPDPVARAVDAALRSAPVSLDWLEQRWVRPPAPLPAPAGEPSA